MRLYRSNAPDSRPTDKPPGMAKIATVALMTPLLATAIGCTRPNEIAQLKTPPRPVVTAVERVAAGSAYSCNDAQKKLVHVDSICVANCDPDTVWAFNYPRAAVMVDCSVGRFYHKFAYNFSGTEMLWEGFGDDRQRMFIRKDGEKIEAIKTNKVGSGWVSDYLMTGQTAVTAWQEFVSKKLREVSH